MLQLATERGKLHIWTTIGGRHKVILHQTIFVETCSFPTHAVMLSNKYSCRVRSQKRDRLDASCGFCRPDASFQQVVSSLLTSSSCIKCVNIRLAAS